MNRIALWYTAVAPGILVAATGVGAGDLLTASFAGSAVGLAVLWAAPAGAVLKWAINEGIARWQLATDTTLLEGWVARLGRPIQWVFLVYLLLWSFAVGGALVSACGVAGNGFFIIGNPTTSKILWGIAHAIAGVVLVRLGGFRLFEKLMGVFIGLMFVTVMMTAVVSPAVARPAVAAAGKAGWSYLDSVLAVLGGVGGTVTVLSYGYWIREARREGDAGMRACRLDLAIGYTMTALFGMAMIVIGSRTDLSGKGAGVAIELANQLAAAIGPVGFWLFLIGFWGAVFSSLLGVWQGVPYLFADFLAIRRGATAEERGAIDFDQTTGYRAYLYALAIVPLPLLWFEIKSVQLAYAVTGAFFMPVLAATLLIMNNRADWVGQRFRSRLVINAILVVTLVFFCVVGGIQCYQTFS